MGAKAGPTSASISVSPLRGDESAPRRVLFVSEGAPGAARMAAALARVFAAADVETEAARVRRVPAEPASLEALAEIGVEIGRASCRERV